MDCHTKIVVYDKQDILKPCIAIESKVNITRCVSLGRITDVILLFAIILLITVIINVSIIFISSFPLICKDVWR